MPAKKNDRHIEIEDKTFDDGFAEGQQTAGPKKGRPTSQSAKKEKTTKAKNEEQSSQPKGNEPEIQFRVVPEVKENKESFRYQIVPYVFFFVSVFLFLCLILEDKVGIVGRFTHRALLGSLSGGAYTIPFFVIYRAFTWHSDRKKNVVKRKIICSCVTVALVSVAIDALSQRAIRFDVPALFAEGAASIGGGVIGGILSSVLRTCFGTVGTLVVIFAVLLAMFLQMFDVTPRTLYISAAYNAKMRKERKATEKAAAAEAALRAKANVNVYRVSKKNNRSLPGTPEDLTNPQLTGAVPSDDPNGRKNPLDHKLEQTVITEKKTRKRVLPSVDEELPPIESKNAKETPDGDIDFSFLDKIDNDFLRKKPAAAPKETPTAPVVAPSASADAPKTS